jgi:hypothetical protein
METQVNTLTLADQFAADQNRHAEVHADARREYDLILSRAARPMVGDAGKLPALALALDIDPATLEADVRRAVAEHEHRLLLEASKKDRDATHTEAESVRQAITAEHAQHIQRVEALKMEQAVVTDHLDSLKKLRDEHAATLAVASAGNDTDAMFRAAQAGLVACNPADAFMSAAYLRCRGWRAMQNAWVDPTNTGSRLAPNLARDTQLRRDIEKLRAELRTPLVNESERIKAAAVRAPAEAAKAKAAALLTA